MRLLPAAIALVLVSAGAACASGEINCRNADGKVSVGLLVGHDSTLMVARATIAINGKTWSSESEIEPGAPVAVGQAYENDGMLLVDFIGAPTGDIVARLKAFSVTEGSDFVSAGVFSFVGEGAWAVDCSERG